MKNYNPNIPLISLHIPKCGGQTLNAVLKDWFGENFFTHYFQVNNRKPEKLNFSGNICIHGHFNNSKGFGAKQYYPESEQFVTFVRDPLEIGISNYFFWKRVARKRQLDRGIIKLGGYHDYKNIDDFFLKRPNSHIFNFIPFELNENNYREIIRENFIYIGLTKNLQDSVNALSEILRFPKLNVKKLNRSERDSQLSEEIKEKFIIENRFVFKVYQFIEKGFLDN